MLEYYGSELIKIQSQLDQNVVSALSKFQYPIDCQWGVDRE